MRQIRANGNKLPKQRLLGSGMSLPQISGAQFVPSRSAAIESIDRFSQTNTRCPATSNMGGSRKVMQGKAKGFAI